MDSKELRGLLEAYVEVYAPKEIEEAYEPMTKERQMKVDRAKKKAYDADQRAQYKGDSAEADKQFKRRMAMDSRTKMRKEELDIFDTVLEFLQAEGYAETLEEAQELMTAVVLEAQAARNNPEKYERESRKSETKGQSAERRVRDRLKTMDPKRAEAMKAQMRAVGLNV